jgi:hypothetical protein
MELHLPFMNVRNFIHCILIACLFNIQKTKAQDYEVQSALYNVIGGAVTGGIGAVINRKEGEKWTTALLKGCGGGAAGGGIMYLGKKVNFLIVAKNDISYAWLSRFVFSAGNSLVENAAGGLSLVNRFHFDVGFVRLNFYPAKMKIEPKIMPGALGGIIFTAFYGRFDGVSTLRSGTVVFRTREISYAPYLVGSTTGNGFLLADTIYGKGYYFNEIFAHEMVHTFQFSEFSGVNYFFQNKKEQWRANSATFAKMEKWIHADLNYAVFMLNYFVVQGGFERSLYCKNFLENEAEWLSTHRVSCPEPSMKH